ncbi:MAG: cryptochrome/photolyase family protein, partial [Gemmatimonadetes bacterium]|nr:cryptochrome/photolyase family protein [Gemmatimonadota bacterium]NNM04713.1 cryptochrome/photolyase family protein [Gemmatimonadota bacterium]
MSDSPTLRFVLGDQLTRTVSSLSDLDPKHDVVLMVEVPAECTYVRHHKKKIAFILSSMRHFAKGLEKEGVQVDYRTLDLPDNRGDFQGELKAAVERHGAGRVVVTEPGEWRVLQGMLGW